MVQVNSGKGMDPLNGERIYVSKSNSLNEHYTEILLEPFLLLFPLSYRNEIGKSACEVCNSIIRLKLCERRI